jgi:hypothetical protein
VSSVRRLDVNLAVLGIPSPRRTPFAVDAASEELIAGVMRISQEVFFFAGTIPCDATIAARLFIAPAKKPQHNVHA